MGQEMSLFTYVTQLAKQGCDKQNILIQKMSIHSSNGLSMSIGTCLEVFVDTIISDKNGHIFAKFLIQSDAEGHKANTYEWHDGAWMASWGMIEVDSNYKNSMVC